MRDAGSEYGMRIRNAGCEPPPSKPVDTSQDLFDVIVVGAGPSGLSVSRELGLAGIRHVVLERGETVGHTWAHLYDGVVLHTGKHFSALPGMRFSSSTPTFPTRRQFVEY